MIQSAIRRVTHIAALAFLAATPRGVAGQEVRDPAAESLLRRMSDVLAAAESFSFRADVSEEEPLADGRMISFGFIADIAVNRPNNIRTHVRGDHSDTRLWYDGTSVTLHDLRSDLYSTASAPATIDQMLDFIHDVLGFQIPLSDLAFSNPYDALTGSALTSVYLGQHLLHGELYHHLSFTTDVVDWQIWITDGFIPLPRQLQIIYKTKPGAPRYTALLSDWQLDVALPAVVFVFEAPSTAVEIDFATTGGNDG